ncbi:hypothetical protein D3C87_1448810 [compost metagenome]
MLLLETLVELDKRVVGRHLGALDQHLEPQVGRLANGFEPRALVHELAHASNPLVAVRRQSPDLNGDAALVHVSRLWQSDRRHVQVALDCVVALEPPHVAQRSDNRRDGLRAEETDALQRGEHRVGLKRLGHGGLVGFELGLEVAVLVNQELQSLGIQRAVHPSRGTGQFH